MKILILGVLATALLTSGCTPMPMYVFQPNSALTDAFHSQDKSTPLTAEQVNEKNAAEIGKRLNEEIQKDEQSGRGNAMERSKLAIP